MKKNMGIFDRIIRTLLALIVVALYVNGQITGMAAIILGIFAVIFLATSFVGFCPLYLLFNIKTCKKKCDDGSCCN